MTTDPRYRRHIGPTLCPRDLDELFALLAEGAGWYEPGDRADPVDLRSHSLQCAEVLAAHAPDDVGLQLAGLTHDLGHLAAPTIPDGIDDDHEHRGAAMVTPLLGARVGRLVSLHVEAKRYLATTDATHRSRLSGGSQASLSTQGGLMSRDELAAFEADPLVVDAIALRRADEAAKRPGAPTRGLGEWRHVALVWNEPRHPGVDHRR